MYSPPPFAEARLPVLYDFIEANPLGILVTTSPDGLFATHLPFVPERSADSHGTLQGHVARANPHHHYALMPETQNAEALVIFRGPDAYITPSWYTTKHEHGKVVPTWDYVAVHVYGTLRIIDDPAFLRHHVTRLSRKHEAGREHPWEVADAPAEFINSALRGIVGLEMGITRIEGKWKASQNRSAEDVSGVISGLSASDKPTDVAMAAIVSARSETTLR